MPYTRQEYYRGYSGSRKNTYATRRGIVLDILGRSCVRCGFDDVRALQIDHIGGGGSKETRDIGARGIQRIIISLGEEAKKLYQILCANCNWIKRHESNENIDRPKKQL